MKRLYAIAVMLLMAFGAHAQEGKNIYSKYSDKDGVSAVYISPSMFRLVGRIPEINVDSEGGNMDIAPLIRSLDGFYLLDISDSSIASALKSDVDAMLRKGRYDLLMEVKDDGDKVYMYTTGDEKTIKSILFLSSDGGSVQFICVDGSMDRPEVEALIAKAAQ